MKVLITGGAGYLGYNLTRRLNEISSVKSIIVYDNLYRNNFNFFFNDKRLTKLKFINEDILNEYALEKACKDVDVVIHLAAYVDFPYSYKDNYKYEQINQFGTGIIYNILKKYPPKKIIYASSGAVYGFQDATENTTVKPENSYGKSKFEGEKYVRLLEKYCDVYILRIGNVFGYNPMFRYDGVINHFIFNSLLYNKIKILGSGDQKRPFVHINHVVDWINQIILEKISYKTINVVQESLSMNEIRDLILKINPNLEFSYLNTNQNYKGYKMSSVYLKINTSIQDDLSKSYQRFKENFIF